MSNKISDYFNVDELFSNEERMIRDAVGEFADNEIIPVIEKHFEEATFPDYLLPQMAELGLFGITIPQEYGGSAANYTSYGLAMQELERADSAIRSYASVQNSLVIYPYI